VTGLALASALCEAKHVCPRPFVFTLRTNPCASGREREVGNRCWGVGTGQAASEADARPQHPS